MRTLTDAQQANVDEFQTRPVFLVRWEHSGVEELLSCGGDVTFDGESYTGGVNIASIQNSRSAILTCPATSARIGEVQNNTWRDGDCVIYYIPSTPSEDTVYVTGDAITILDGKITASKFASDRITVSVIHKNLEGNFTPRNVVDEVGSHIPAPGTSLLWDGETIVLVGTR